jgi:putative endonuclease
MESFFVYILESLQDGTLYKGYTTDYKRRLEEHNAGKSRYTSKKVPWKLLYVECCKSKTEALIREKSLKRANKSYIQWLIGQPTNLLNS